MIDHFRSAFFQSTIWPNKIICVFQVMPTFLKNDSCPKVFGIQDYFFFNVKAKRHIVMLKLR